MLHLATLLLLLGLLAHPMSCLASPPDRLALATGTQTFPDPMTMSNPSWTSVPYPEWLAPAFTPFCINEADPDLGVGNHCACRNGAIVANIPFVDGPDAVITYQPCVWTTIGHPGDQVGTVSPVVSTQWVTTGVAVPTASA